MADMTAPDGYTPHDGGPMPVGHPMIEAQTVTVYHSGRRRYLSLKAACRDAARIRVFKQLREMGEDPLTSEDWWRPRVDRLARLYVRSFRVRPAP